MCVGKWLKKQAWLFENLQKNIILFIRVKNQEDMEGISISTFHGIALFIAW